MRLPDADADYVESCWWALKTIHGKGLLYEKLKVVPYGPRDQVTLSSHELGQPGAYKDVTDPSVYVRLAVTDPRGPLRAGDELVVWTTTPWTLVSNAAVAVNPGLQYVRASTPDGRVQVVASDLVTKVLGEQAQILDTFAGATLVGTRYEAPFRTSRPRPTDPRATRCCPPSSSPPTTAPASYTPRSRSATTTSASARSRA